MKTFDCCLQLVITHTLPDGSSSVMNRSTIDYTDVDTALHPSFLGAYKEALDTIGELQKAIPAGADAIAFSGQIGIYFSDGTKQEHSFASLNFAGAQALMHAGIDLLAALANLPYQSAAQASLTSGGIKSVLPLAARSKLKHLSFIALLAFLLAGPAPRANCQATPEFYWTKIDGVQEYALWHDGVQVGGYRLSDESYYPRLAPGRWGDACACPCPLPPAIEAALAEYRKANWKSRGVLMGPPNIRKTNSGLSYHNLPMPREKKPAALKGKRGSERSDCAPVLSGRLSDDIERIPEYAAMPSLTLVARDEAHAKAALEMFETAPELVKWREKYGPRAKAYGALEFQGTGAAFKLDQDRQFQDAGFVAIVQPQAPDADGQAEVKSYYTWATPEQALTALRDADPLYDPNPAPVQPAVPAAAPAAAPDGVWGKAIAAAGLGGSGLAMLLGAIVSALKTILG